MSNLRKLEKLLAQSPLSTAQQHRLIILFSYAGDADLEPIVELFSEDPSWITTIHQNYVRKSDASRQRDSVAWEDIVQDEVRALQK